MKKATTALSVCMLSAMSLGAYAATATPAENGRPQSSIGDSPVEEIIVTARKRAESLQDVPISVFAIAEEGLQNNLATDLMKLGELAPQVLIGKGVSGTGALITMRGISSSSSDAGLDQSVSISLDDVPLSRGRIITASLFDMKQVEVLQGPQALFFGKNSPAGVISMQSADPSDIPEGYLKAGYEMEANERYLEGAISGPITESLKARFAFRGDSMDGWIRNVSQPGPNPFHPDAPIPGARHGDKLPDSEDLAGRVTFLWTPTEDFSAKLKLTMNQQEINGNGAYGETFCIGATTVPSQLGVPMPNSDCRKNRVRAETALPPEFTANYPYVKDGSPYQQSRFVLSSLGLSKTFGDLSLESTTGFYNQTVQGSHNGDYGAFAQIYATERERYKLLTQELRLTSDFSGPINFLAGAYFEQADRRWASAVDLFHDFDPVADSYVTNVQLSDSDNQSYSLFGQLVWTPNEHWELAGGVRYTRDRKESEFVNVRNNMNSALGRSLLPQGQILYSRYRDDNVSPEVTLSWKPIPDHIVYAAYKAGYKAGGISNSALLQASFTPESVQFGAEEVDGFEAGYKADLLGRTLRLDVVAYRYNYDGLQVTAFDPVLIRNNVGNAANARTTGVSGSFRWLATSALSFNGNVGYNRARYIRFPNAQCYPGQTAALGCVGGVQDLSRKTLNRAPKLTFSLGADYSVNVFGDWNANFSVDGSYTSSYQTATDYAPGGYQSSFWRLNAAVHLSPANERFQVSLIGRNLTDEYYLLYAVGQPGVGNTDQYFGVFNRPREVVLQASYRW